MGNVEANHKIKAELKIGSDYAELGHAFKSVTTALNEVAYSAFYLADSGFASNEVLGMAPSVTLAGDYITGDPVCEYLSEIEFELGESRKSELKLTRGGKIIVCPVTLTQINIAGGEATASNAVNITLAFNGKPTITTEISG